MLSSIESRGDENSSKPELSTSRDSTEGTVDLILNEAPRCPECGYTEADARILMDHYACKNYPFFTQPGGYEVGCMRDGRPANPTE